MRTFGKIFDNVVSSYKKMWCLENQILYDLCENHPGHKNDNEIIAKICLIGRAYAAAIERRKNANEKDEVDFYTKVVKIIKDANFDKAFKELDKKEDGVFEKYFTVLKAFHQISGMNKISLASKYLHFHFPNEYYIYDSRAASSIGKLIRYLNDKGAKIKTKDYSVNDKWKKESYFLEEPDGQKKNRLIEYIHFYNKASVCVNKIKELFAYDLCPRDLDSLLLAINAGQVPEISG